MAGIKYVSVPGSRKTCPVCGREFWVQDATMWAYREYGRNNCKKGYICSWHCQCEHNRQREAQEAQKKKPAAVCRERKANAAPKSAPEYAEQWCYLGNLRDVMDRKNMTGVQLEKKTGIPAITIYGWRQGRGKCPYWKALVLADALGVDPEEIITQDVFLGELREQNPSEGRVCAKNLDALMTSAGIGDKQLERMTGVHRSSVYRYRKRMGTCPIDRAEIIAGALGVTVRDLVGGDPGKRKAPEARTAGALDGEYNVERKIRR